MIVYFANRNMQILGQASTNLPNGYAISEDLKTEDIESGVATFSCRIGFDAANRAALEEMTEAGNYLLRSNGGENEFYTIIETEIDTKNRDIYIYAEDAGLDLLNEIADEFEATESHTAEWYVSKYIADSGFEIGINEIPASSTRKLKWEGESTVTERLASIATQFGGFEVSYSFAIRGMEITNKYINLYQQRGKDVGEQLRLNRDIDRIVTKKSVADLATAFVCTGGTPDDAEKPITLSGYKYDDGDFYVSGDRLYSRKAAEKWSRYVWNKEPNQLATGNKGHIVRPYSYDTTSQATLCAHAITELKKVCDMAINYEVDITALDAKIGDRINIVDDAGELYLSTRILMLETSVVDKKQTATLGEHLIKSHGISQKVADLAAQFAKESQSTARALAIANNAKLAADNAQEQANTAVENATNAQKAAENATSAANTAQESATQAQTAADNAQTAVDKVEESITSLETTVTEASTAAQNAQKAADEATAKADEAKTAAANAEVNASTAKTEAETAKATAESAISKAETAEGTANTAKTEAESAKETAEAAKADAEQAEKDIADLGDRITTVTTTMEVDYARKTELTETEAKLQSQITQNAGVISSAVSMLATIDETANDAEEQAEKAQKRAQAAREQADLATDDAIAAQEAADNAKTAADNAQAEADTAQAAADLAQAVADQAEADLARAQADLETVQSRADATEEEIAAAREAVETAQTAANAAKADAQTAAEEAATAQETADKAVAESNEAQAVANAAASYAKIAQSVANESENAVAAQTTADDAASAAAEAQRTAETAQTNAENAQSKADEAASKAAAAQTAADEADAKAAKAASDLATAEQNLADVTSRVDATEEEVAAAQQAVNTAQAAADLAKQEAEAAQTTADTAKANAATAQAAADNAKTVADNAQAAADEAQKAADDAQAAVDALEIRVTTAETNITQNSEKIALAATKKEVTETLGGYYTKEETDAALTVKADEITSTVSSTYATKQDVEDIEVGGRNLLLFTEDLPIDYLLTTGVGSWSWKGLTKTDDGLRLDADSTVDSNSFWVPLAYKGAVENNEEVTLSFDYRGNFTRFGNFYFVHETDNTSCLVTDWDIEASETEWKHFRKTFSMENANSEGCISVLLFYGHINTSGNESWIEVKNKSLKLEKGDKSTDWTPALEDVFRDIELAQETADNALTSVSTAETTIQQLADSIASLVRDGNGGSLIKQGSDGLYYFDISEIEDNISDTANAVSDLEGVVLDVNGQIDVLKSTAAALQQRTEYVRSYTDENDQPCLELGEGDSTYKAYITNSGIQLMDGSTAATVVNRQMLIIEKALIKTELQIGDDTDTSISGVWVWKRRNNGNFGLMWKGVTS